MLFEFNALAYPPRINNPVQHRERVRARFMGNMKTRAGVKDLVVSVEWKTATEVPWLPPREAKRSDTASTIEHVLYLTLSEAPPTTAKMPLKWEGYRIAVDYPGAHDDDSSAMETRLPSSSRPSGPGSICPTDMKTCANGKMVPRGPDCKFPSC